jgi:hypothetical protein
MMEILEGICLVHSAVEEIKDLVPAFSLITWTFVLRTGENATIVAGEAGGTEVSTGQAVVIWVAQVSSTSCSW